MVQYTSEYSCYWRVKDTFWKKRSSKFLEWSADHECWILQKYIRSTLSGNYLSSLYRVIQEELPPLTELISGDILSKKCHINQSPILNIYGVHFAGLLDIQNILLAGTVVYPGKLKVIHLVIIWSVGQWVLCHCDGSLNCALLSLWLVWVNVQSACTLNTRTRNINVSFLCTTLVWNSFHSEKRWSICLPWRWGQPVLPKWWYLSIYMTSHPRRQQSS
jgi:hypothetical protein